MIQFFGRDSTEQSPFQLSQRRIGHQKLTRKKTGHSFFTSDLSTNEVLLAREAGCDPIGLVMGSSFYQVGFMRNFWGYRNYTGEVTVLTQAQLTARELAVTRLQQEAALLGAHGVIGVRLTKRRKGLGMGLLEFTAIGTAIRIPGMTQTKKPFTSDLSGQEFWKLRMAGYLPKGLVFGACAYYVHSDRTTRQIMNQSGWNALWGKGRQNQEMEQFTQGFQAARELAIFRLTADIQHLGATGSVGMTIESSEETIVHSQQSLLGYLLVLIYLLLIPFMVILAYVIQLPAIGCWILGAGVLLGPTRWTNWRRGGPGPYKDLLITFIAIGTAIVEDQIPPVNPVSKTLVFTPLSNA